MNKRMFSALIPMVIILVLTCTACSSAIQNSTASNSNYSTEPAITENNKPAAAYSTEPVTLENPEPAVDATEKTLAPMVEEDNVRYVTQYLEKVKSYNNIHDLDSGSELVFSGECISAEPVFQNMTLYTLSKIKVEKAFKGNIAKDDVILFVEVGGRVTNGEYTKGCEIPEKEFAKDAPRLPDDQQLVTGVDGFFPFRQGEKVLLFAEDVSGFLEKVDEPLYGVTGGYDGKLFLQDGGSYARPLPSQNDKHIFGEKSLCITIDELGKHYNESQ
jgi:hypothetical protein